MDLYAIHKTFTDMQSVYGDQLSPAARDNMARMQENILLRLFKVNRNSRPFDGSFVTDIAADFQPPIIAKQRNNSIDFVAYPQMTRPQNGNARDLSSFGAPKVTLADQFTWGAVVCAGVFIVVFVCVMAAWWVHKKQQDRIRRRVAQSEAAQRPYCIENDPRGHANMVEVQRPPSYFEVIGFFDPPPSYSDILRVNSTGQLQPSQAYDNVAVTIDELPPPFAEEAEKSESKMPAVTVDVQHEGPSAIDSNNVRSTATVITVRDDSSTTNSSS